MNNKEILKAMAEVLPVRHGERKFQRVVDYSANGDIYGTIRYTAGCIDERNMYWSMSSSELVCDIDLSNTNLKKPVWTSPYSSAKVIQAIKDKTPVTVGSYQFRRISRLSTIVDRVTGEYRYVAACEDLYGNIVVARVEQVSITGSNQRLEERRSVSHEE